MLYLGTHNAEKAKNMEVTLKLAIGDIALSDIFSFNFPSPKEVGETEIDRAKLKSGYYFQHLNVPVISEDDGFYFENNPQIGGLSVSDIDTGGLSTFDFWKNLFMENGVNKGILRKAYSICTQDHHNSTSVDIPFFIFAKKKQSTVNQNALNQFIVPNGFQNPIAYMTNSERHEFRLKYLVDPIKGLLIRSNLITE